MEVFPFHKKHKILDYRMCILAHDPCFVMLEARLTQNPLLTNIIQGHQSQCDLELHVC